MTQTPVNAYSAADPALGYLYQIRLALLLALRKCRLSPDFSVAIEVLDDVSFDAPGEPPELLQTKHSIRAKANLTDASPDLWKTLRAWIAGLKSGLIPSDGILNLITTATAAPGSVASLLKEGQRDPVPAMQKLEATARTSSNKDNAEAYTAFLGLSDSERQALVRSIRILDGAISIVGIGSELATEIAWVADRSHADPCLQRLEGWWNRRVISHLVLSPGNDRICGYEIEAQITDLRDQFSREGLPIDHDLLDLQSEDPRLAALQQFPFVMQLDLAKPGTRRMLAAIRDYYRAYTQRSRWVRDHLLMVGDIDRYEDSLFEEWELYFEARVAELGASPTEEQKRAIALKVLEWAETCCLPIRALVRERFVTRGSLHMLANDLKVGWHPDFRERMEKLLGITKAVAA